MKGTGFFGRLLACTVVVITITAAGVYSAAFPLIEDSLEREAERRVRREAAWAAEFCVEAYDSQTNTFHTGGFTSLAAQELGSRFTLIAPSGEVLFDSSEDASKMDNHAQRAEVRELGTIFTRFSRTLEKEMTFCAVEVRTGGELRGYARVAVPVEDREGRLGNLRSAVRNGAILAALLSLIPAIYFARRVTHPLSEIAGLVTEIGGGQTTRRLRVDRDDEVGRLASAVNSMADDLLRQSARVDRDRNEREAIFSALQAGLLAVNGERNVLFINQQARVLLDGPEADLKKRPVSELTRNSAVTEVIDRCLAQGARVSGEARVAHEEGERILELTGVPLAGRPEGGLGCVLELRDVSDLRRLEAVRRDFVSNVSHELKTPLTSMRGFTEAVIDDPEMPAAQRQAFLTKAQRNTERLSAIVGDLLSLSRLESEGSELSFDSLDIVELTREVMAELGDLAGSKRMGLELSVEEPSIEVSADAQALGMAISNLISNAIRYSPEGSDVRIEISPVDEGLALDVIDQGPGIPSQFQERIFERFFRLDRARSRKLGGTGLGLAIVRHVMSAHGGRVELDSEEGRGSRFRLLLPLR